MIVRTLEECKNSSRAIDGGNWESVRMLLKDDNMGFSFHITTIFAGTETLYITRTTSNLCTACRAKVKLRR